VTELALVLFALAVTIGAPPLIHGGWTYRAPGLGILAWQAAAVAVVSAIAYAGAAAVFGSNAVHRVVGAARQICLDVVHGAHGPRATALLLVGLLVVGTVTARLAMAGGQVLAQVSRQRRAQLAMLHVAGLPGLGRDFTVLSHPDPAAYVVPGRRPCVVVTTATLRRLSPSELAAVLAHERAHAAGRHHWLLDAAAVLRRAFPRLPLFTDGAREMARLVEMRADDIATRTNSRLVLARALVAMATPASASDAGRGMLNASDGDAVDRLHRLLDPAPPLSPAVRVAAGSAVAALPLLPMMIVLGGTGLA
jgi:Zn-dependent protease with chaperone function